jgi:hypothetical protein
MKYIVFVCAVFGACAYADAQPNVLMENIRLWEKSMHPNDDCSSEQPGTCYFIMECNGDSVHVDNGPDECPSGYSSFEYDTNPSECGCFGI